MAHYIHLTNDLYWDKEANFKLMIQQQELLHLEFITNEL